MSNSDETILSLIEQEEKLGHMPIDSLIILSRLREERRLGTADLAPSVQKTEANVRATLEKLVETGFLEPHGTGRGRTYTLRRLFTKMPVRKRNISDRLVLRRFNRSKWCSATLKSMAASNGPMSWNFVI